MSGEEKIIMMVREAYINTYGAEKWNALTDEEKHDVTMILVKDMLKAMESEE